MDTNYVNKVLEAGSNTEWEKEVKTLTTFFDHLDGYYIYILEELDSDAQEDSLKRLQEFIDFAMQRAELHFICALKNNGKWPDSLIGLIFSMGKFAGCAIECKKQEVAQKTVTDCISKIWSSTWDSFEHLDDIIEGYFDYDIDYIFCCDY